MLVGDAPYYSRFGFVRLNDVEMPPPTNPERVLGVELVPDAWCGITGKVTPLRLKKRAGTPMFKAWKSFERTLTDMDTDARLDELARRHVAAGNVGIQILNMVGGQAEGLLDRLPTGVRDRLGDGAEQALKLAMSAAQRSRGVVGEQPAWLTRVVTTAMGAAGGFLGGLPSAMAELPVTTTILLRAIQDVAIEHGFNPEEQGVMFDCIQVLAAAGPLDHDDGSDIAFLSTRLAVTGSTIQTLIARVAPRLATVLGQKLAAQTVPILGAAAGAATNYAYTSYYQQMAQVHFGLRRLAIEADRDHAELIEEFRTRRCPGSAAPRLIRDESPLNPLVNKAKPRAVSRRYNVGITSVFAL